MHDTDIDPDTAKFIQEMLAKGSHLQRGLITQSADRLGWGEGLELGWDATGDLEAVTDTPGKELVPYESAGAVELRNRSRVPDTLAPATSGGLDLFIFEREVVRVLEAMEPYGVHGRIRLATEDTVKDLTRAC